MDQSEEREREIAELRDRLSRLSAASLRINESLDFDTVLQGVLDSARSLTEARYGVITLLDDSGRIADFLSSGMTAEEARLLWSCPAGCGYSSTWAAPGNRCGSGTCSATSGRWAFPSSARRWRWDPSCPLWPRRSFTGTSLPDTSTLLRRRGAGSSPPKTRRRWSCSLPRRRWSSPTPAGTGKSSGPGPGWKP